MGLVVGEAYASGKYAFLTLSLRAMVSGTRKLNGDAPLLHGAMACCRFLIEVTQLERVSISYCILSGEGNFSLNPSG